MDSDRKNFHNQAEITKNKNKELIDKLKEENTYLTKLCEDLEANKRAGHSSMTKTTNNFVSFSK